MEYTLFVNLQVKQIYLNLVLNRIKVLKDVFDHFIEKTIHNIVGFLGMKKFKVAAPFLITFHSIAAWTKKICMLSSIFIF